jgi:hypothetical protein
MYEEELYKALRCGNLSKRGHLEDPGVDGKILRRIFKNWDGAHVHGDKHVVKKIQHVPKHI